MYSDTDYIEKGKIIKHIVKEVYKTLKVLSKKAKIVHNDIIHPVTGVPHNFFLSANENTLFSHKGV